MKDPYDILIRPLITEKAGEGETLDPAKYTFEVAMHANKVQIRRAVEICFNVHVKQINTVRMKGKRKRLRSPRMGQRRSWKKAVVTLEPGQTIELI
jgi:large subunit ribosomal protein L23